MEESQDTLKLKRPHKKQAHAEEGGEGNWLVSYADMMTLLVGFFIILLSFSKTDEKKLDEVRQAAAKEFGGSYQIPYGNLAGQIRQTLEKQGFGDQFSIKQTSLGVNISFVGAAFFDTGSTEVKEKANELMNKLVPLLQEDAKDFQVVIEGHTDDVPIVSSERFRSNWELSGLRASRVLEIFEKYGYSKSKLTAVGYGDARPIVPNRDTNGVAIPTNQSQNRRVVIKLIKNGEEVLGEGSGDVKGTNPVAPAKPGPPASAPANPPAAVPVNPSETAPVSVAPIAPAPGEAPAPSSENGH